MSENNENQNQKKPKTFEELVGSAVSQQRQAVESEYKKKADEWAKKRREALKALASIDAEREKLEEDYAAELERFK